MDSVTGLVTLCQRQLNSLEILLLVILVTSSSRSIRVGRFLTNPDIDQQPLMNQVWLLGLLRLEQDEE